MSKPSLLLFCFIFWSDVIPYIGLTNILYVREKPCGCRACAPALINPPDEAGRQVTHCHLLNNVCPRGVVGRACTCPRLVEQHVARIYCDKNIFYCYTSLLENIFKSHLKSFIIAKYTLSYFTHNVLIVEFQLLQVVWNTNICGVYIQKWKNVNRVITYGIHIF